MRVPVTPRRPDFCGHPPCNLCFYDAPDQFGSWHGERRRRTRQSASLVQGTVIIEEYNAYSCTWRIVDQYALPDFGPMSGGPPVQNIPRPDPFEEAAKAYASEAAASKVAESSTTQVLETIIPEGIKVTV